MSYEAIKPPITPNNSLDPKLHYVDNKIRVKFDGSYLKQNKITYTHGTIVNIYIVYEITKNIAISSYPTLENCLFGAVKFLKIVILISINILDMVLDLIEGERFHLVMDLVKM